MILLCNLTAFFFSSISTLYLEELVLLMVFADDKHLQRGSFTSGCVLIFFGCLPFTSSYIFLEIRVVLISYGLTAVELLILLFYLVRASHFDV